MRRFRSCVACAGPARNLPESSGRSKGARCRAHALLDADVARVRPPGWRPGCQPSRAAGAPTGAAARCADSPEAIGWRNQLASQNQLGRRAGDVLNDDDGDSDHNDQVQP